MAKHLAILNRVAAEAIFSGKKRLREDFRRSKLLRLGKLVEGTVC